jgi:hypothetical protein
VNTPGHGVLNLAVLGRPEHPEWNVPIVLGAVVPDLPMFVLAFVATVVLRQPQRQIWSETYFQPGWQIAADVPHSFPLLLGAFAAAAALGRPRVQRFVASMLLHSCFDVFVHGTDAHRHFFPLTGYQFVSGISYWDPTHHGTAVFIVETLVVIASSVYAWPIVRSRSGRRLLLLTAAAYTAAAVALWLLRR